MKIHAETKTKYTWCILLTGVHWHCITKHGARRAHRDHRIFILSQINKLLHKHITSWLIYIHISMQYGYTAWFDKTVNLSLTLKINQQQFASFCIGEVHMNVWHSGGLLLPRDEALKCWPCLPCLSFLLISNCIESVLFAHPQMLLKGQQAMRTK